MGENNLTYKWIHLNYESIQIFSTKNVAEDVVTTTNTATKTFGMLRTVKHALSVATRERLLCCPHCVLHLDTINPPNGVKFLRLYSLPSELAGSFNPG